MTLSCSFLLRKTSFRYPFRVWRHTNSSSKLTFFFRRRTFAKVCGKWLCKSSHFIDLLLLQMFVGWLLIEYQHIKGYENGYWGGWGCFINHPLPPHNLPPGGGIYLFGAMKYHFARRVFYGTRNSIFWLNLLSMKNELLIRYSVPKSRNEKLVFWISRFLWKNELLFKTHQNKKFNWQ